MLINEKLLAGFLTNKPEGYKSHIYSFDSFINDKIKGSDFLLEYLMGISTSTIIDSIDYYIEKNKITSVNRVEHYATAIKEYVLYLFSNNFKFNQEFKNQILLPSFDKNSYWYRIKEHIREKENLNEQKSFNSLSNEEYEGIMIRCNEVINDSKYLDKEISKNGFEDITSALLIKITLSFGLKYNVISNLKLKDIDFKYNTLNINGYSINLPNQLIDDLGIYEHIISLLKNDKKRKFLLCDMNLEKLSKNTTTCSNFLRNISGRGDFNGLIQFVIVRMLKNGIDSFVIRDFTGNKDTIIKKCQEQVFRENKNEYLNAKLITLGIAP